jgi:nucleotide-binding universal stress UspA family protein
VYRTIMVPLDGSTFAEAALPLAISLGRRTGARLRLVTVHEPIPSFAYDEWESASREWTTDYLRRTVERIADSGLTATSELRTGPVVEALDSEADSCEASLVVMATHGRGLLSRAWLGSVADAFVRHTNRPVLLVRPSQEDGSVDITEDRKFGNVLIPLDGSALSEDAKDHAVELGALFEAGYHLVRVVPYPADVASSYLPYTVQVNQGIVDEAKLTAAAYLEGQAEALRSVGHRVTTGVQVDAQPGHGILRAAEAEGCDLIAMATHGRSGLTRALLGSASDKVLRGTHLPLLLHRPPT